MRFNAVLNSVDPATREEIERLHAVVRRCKVEQQPLSPVTMGISFVNGTNAVRLACNELRSNLPALPNRSSMCVPLGGSSQLAEVVLLRISVERSRPCERRFAC
jgi:hypothetical protein